MQQNRMYRSGDVDGQEVSAFGQRFARPMDETIHAENSAFGWQVPFFSGENAHRNILCVCRTDSRLRETCELCQTQIAELERMWELNFARPMDKTPNDLNAENDRLVLGVATAAAMRLLDQQVEAWKRFEEFAELERMWQLNAE
jgi:hypothetical protein